MAGNRRRSNFPRTKRTGAVGCNAVGCGPFGIFLNVAAVELVIKYWWGLLIALGRVAVTATLVRSARAAVPPVTAPPPKPLRAPEARCAPLSTPAMCGRCGSDTTSGSG